MKQQYTIDESLVEPRWTELGLARLLSDGAYEPGDLSAVPDKKKKRR